MFVFRISWNWFQHDFITVRYYSYDAPTPA